LDGGPISTLHSWRGCGKLKFDVDHCGHGHYNSRGFVPGLVLLQTSDGIE
jgi:hypothetical protein